MLAGRLFGELMLTFGGVSSSSIYNDPAEMVKKLAILECNIDSRMVNQTLDDVVSTGAEGDGTVTSFHNAYGKICDELGVSLADLSDVDKAFAATHTGKVLGISYNLKTWSWWLSEDKLGPFITMLARVRDSRKISNEHMLSLNGKLNHYMWLVPSGPWQRGFLLPLQDSRGQGNLLFEVSDLAKEQADWWIVNLRVASTESRILDPRPMSSMLARACFTDAAGGSEGKLKNGAGGFCPPHHWFYLPWPKVIQENRQNSLGVKFSSKLCVLEGYAALLGLVTIPDIARNKEICLKVDNSGFIGVYAKKHSSCPYSYTIAKAIHDVGEGLGCKVNVVKTKRCSGPGEIAADALSHGDFKEAWALMPMKNQDPGKIPPSLTRWINNPVPDLNLGKKVLSDMSKYTKVLHIE